MQKNIVILCDGTSNEISGDRTNILRLYGTLLKNDSQLVFYDPGVGTFGAENSPFRYKRKAAEILGLATGWGLDKNVKEAYQFLVDNYNERHSDNIYLFGFSRGAYTARVLAGLIHAIGIIRPENSNLIDYAYRAYKDLTNENNDELSNDDVFADVRMFERLLEPRRATIQCLGLFDTVGSVIEFSKRGPRFKYHAMTAENPSVISVRHAVAVDERRSMFQPQLWKKGNYFQKDLFDKNTRQPQDVKEVWFTGTHSDIGGGHPEKESGLAKISLSWMIEETGALGLTYDKNTIDKIVLGKSGSDKYSAPNPDATIHNSLTLGWKIVELVPRRLRKNSTYKGANLLGLYWLFSKRRKIPTDADIHESVYAREGEKQPNLPDQPDD